MKNLTIKELVKEAHATAKSKGWDEKAVNIPGALCLIHSEISECLEEHREKKEPIYFPRMNFVGPSKPEGMAIELADAVIRIAHLCGRMGWDLDRAVQLKLAYNRTRPYRHGGKVC